MKGKLVTTTHPIGVAVVGAGMAGKAHANAYRQAGTVYEPTLPEIRLVAICDAYEPLAKDTAARYGFERHETDWQAIAADPSIHAVSVVVANRLHREIAEALLAAGKHVLCEKPLADTLEDAQAMADAAEASGQIASIGWTNRRTPAIAFARELVQSGRLGNILHFSGNYWADYGAHADVPLSWRYQGPMGSGALGDVGSHLTYVAEFVCGDILSVSGARMITAITERARPVGAVAGHTRGGASDGTGPVTNDDYAGFTVEFAGGAAGSLEVSRVAHANPSSLEFEVYGTKGAVRWSQKRYGEVELAFADEPGDAQGFRTVQLGPAHPYWKGGLAMDAPGVGHGQNDPFVYQARAFLEEIAGIDGLPRGASFSEGVRNIRIQESIVESWNAGGASVAVPSL